MDTLPILMFLSALGVLCIGALDFLTWRKYCRANQILKQAEVIVRQAEEIRALDRQAQQEKERSL